jgi:hypothetical protein
MAAAVFLGSYHSRSLPCADEDESDTVSVPDIGRLLVLNGCGISGAASVVAGYLRDNRFDVKNHGDAETWNYPSTIIVSKTKDMTVARRVAAALKTNKIVLLRDGDETYDVTVILGSDFGERIE